MSALPKQRKLAHWQEWRMWHEFMWWWDQYMAMQDYQLALNSSNEQAVARIGCNLEWGDYLRHATEHSLNWYYEQNIAIDPATFVSTQVVVQDSALSAYMAIFEAFMDVQVISIEYHKMSLKNAVQSVSRGIFLEGVNLRTNDRLSFPLSIIEQA